MMTMLHSVLSGGGSAAGRRRSLLALGALLALVASVLIWATPTQAQNNVAPIAIATTDSAVDQDGKGTLTSSSFDPDGDELSYKWEVLTEAYSWLSLDAPTSAETKFTVPTAALAARYGQTIEFKLTVTDDGAPSASSSATTTFNINQGPTADIAVSAKLYNPDATDEDGDGAISTAERYTIDGIISGPGEDGNADNEWNIAEGALLVLDGSGSSDPNGRISATVGYLWDRLYQGPGGTEDTTDRGLADPGGQTGGPAKLSTDGGADDVGKTVAQLAKVDSPYFVYYSLAVNDSAGTSSAQAVVKIVILDQPATPTVKIGQLDTDRLPENAADPEYTDGIEEAVPPGSGKYVISQRIAKAGVTISATGNDNDNTITDAADEDATGLTFSWEGARKSDDDQTMATFKAPADVADGDSFTVTVDCGRFHRTLRFSIDNHRGGRQHAAYGDDSVRHGNAGLFKLSAAEMEQTAEPLRILVL